MLSYILRVKKTNGSAAQHQLWLKQAAALISTGSKVTEYQSLLNFIPKVFEGDALFFSLWSWLDRMSLDAERQFHNCNVSLACRRWRQLLIWQGKKYAFLQDMLFAGMWTHIQSLFELSHKKRQQSRQSNAKKQDKTTQSDSQLKLILPSYS